MESYQIEHLTFTYPNAAAPALNDIFLSVHEGEFITLFGKSGCGKTTLLRQLKPAIAPFGTKNGSILFFGQPLAELEERTQSAEIGFVLQRPDNQIVTDKVWHELAFGLESLGLSTSEIRARTAEMASFFGIQTWFHKKVTELSGGQKQLLNLASVMVMQPSVLILDEPTSQLDPIAAQNFLEILAKINRETGITVILTEHRLEEAFPLSDRVVLMDKGEIATVGTPDEVGEKMKSMGHDMCAALPAPMRIFARVENDFQCPVTVREGRKWLEKIANVKEINKNAVPQDKQNVGSERPLVELKDVWFRYGKELPDVIQGLSAKINCGELYAIVGGNGTGKTTALSLISGLFSPYRGQVLIGGTPLEKVENKYRGLLGVLPQNPQALFVKKTVELDLLEMLDGSGLTKQEKAQRVRDVSKICELDGLLSRHPYDLSGGEQQRAALAKILLCGPEILLLDEPTKGLDAYFKETLAGILSRLKQSGVTIIMVSHDIEFCARFADRCAMFFDGAIVSENSPRAFFSGKSFYTTAASRMARTVLPEAVLAEDVILACGGAVPLKEHRPQNANDTFWEKDGMQKTRSVQKSNGENKINASKAKLTPKRIVFGALFGVLFVLTMILSYKKFTDWRSYVVQALSVLELALCLVNLVPQKALGTQRTGTDGSAGVARTPAEKRKSAKRTRIASAVALLAVPLTIFIGIYCLGDRKYYFISLLIILETLLPFAMVFEQRSPKARELVVISVLCAIAVAGRIAFSAFPQFKPVAALVIIAGVCFGGETGFLVGAVTSFLSNFFFSQGPWTPWQMFAFGIIGFLAGLLFQKRFLHKTRGALCIFGGLAAFFVYGGIMNAASVLMVQAKPNVEMFLSAYILGLPSDLIHAAGTVFFLWFLSGPMIEKLDRIKLKYGLVDR